MDLISDSFKGNPLSISNHLLIGPKFLHETYTIWVRCSKVSKDNNCALSLMESSLSPQLPSFLCLSYVTEMFRLVLWFCGCLFFFLVLCTQKWITSESNSITMVFVVVFVVALGDVSIERERLKEGGIQIHFNSFTIHFF